MFFILTIFIIIALCAIWSNDENSSASDITSQYQKQAPMRSTPPPMKRFDMNNSDDVIRVIALLAECVASHSDSSFYVVFETDNRNGDNRKITINGSIDDWADTFISQKGVERWRWLSPEDAAFLDSVPFIFDGDNAKYTYFTQYSAPIGYRNQGVAAVKQGISKARFRCVNIKVEEYESGIMFFCR